MNIKELDRELDMINLMIKKIAAEKKLEKVRLELQAEKDKISKRSVDEMEEPREKRSSSEDSKLDFEY